MNIMILTTKLYSSENSGYTRRLYPFLKELKLMGHSITLITFIEHDKELLNLNQKSEYYDKLIPVKMSRKCGYLRMLRSLFSFKPSKLEFLNTLKMKQAIKKELNENNYDVIYAHFYRMAEYMKHYKNYYRVVDLCDANSLLYERQLKYEKNLFKKIYLLFEKNLVYKYEKSCIKEFDKIFFIADKDRDYLAESKYNEKMIVIPNGIDINYFKDDNTVIKNKREIMYMGVMSSSGNHTAVMYFIDEIYPLIKNEIPDITFKIIGSNPRKELFERAKNDKSIIITGRVDDIRKYALSSVISVAPIVVGAGVQNKILESMAMGIPVVTTIEGAEGLDISDDILFKSNNKYEFAKYVCKLILDEEYRINCSRRSRQICEDQYSWKNNALLIEKSLKKLVINK